LQGVSVPGFDVQGDRVAAVRTSAGSVLADQVMIATGAWSGVVSGWLGRPIPVGPQRGQIMALTPAPGQPQVRHVLHGPGGYVIPKGNGTAVVGATHEMVGFDARVTTSGLKFLADLSTRLAPGAGLATLKHVWLGFRPVLLADGLPLVGRLPGLTNAFVAAGHGAIGLTVSARWDICWPSKSVGEEPDQALTPFDPA
jgi:glycine oxidase